MTATASRTEPTGDAVTDEIDPPADDAASPNEPDGRSRRLVPVVLLALSLALVVTGGIFLVRAARLDDSSASRNQAVVDRARTSEVIGQVSTALNQVLSYDYRRPQTAQAAAARYLTGDAPAQYRLLFGQLQKLAPGQQLTLTAKVATAGVTSLRGDTARLLVFLDQRSTRASDQQSSVSAAQVQITAVHSRSGWRISELKPL